MEKVVFCPDRESVKEAEALASESGLMVQVGDSEATKNLSFDRTQIQVLKIPVNQQLIVSKTFFRLGQMLRVEYIDEFDSVENVKLRIVGDSGSNYEIDGEVFYEGAAIVFRTRPPSIGKHIGEIFDNKGVIADFTFEVRG